jgi:acetylornithine deacetylase/succinyl-diaminopimelate desuccinylase-like protein
MDFTSAAKFVHDEWNASILTALSKYIEIPNQSPLFDPEVLTNGYQDQAVDLMMKWVTSQNVPGLKMRLVTEEKRTPVIFIEVEGTDATSETVLAYGHLDKQPPMKYDSSNPDVPLWEPRAPIIKDGKLYGRGGADDGYAIFASITALKTVKAQGLPHARTVIIIEACEESGSFDLPHYIQLLKEEIGSPSLVVCLDSGCGNYDQLWLTATLRGMLFGVLKVSVSSEGVHSGSGSGIIPSTFRIIRELLDRIEDSKTGKILVESLHVDIPAEHRGYAEKTAAALGDSIVKDYPFLSGVQPMSDNLAECLLNKCWRPTLSYTGVDGIPAIASAGNVLRPYTSLGLSFRLPPTANAAAVYAELKEILERDPPSGAHVSFVSNKFAAGWKAPELKPWLTSAIDTASTGAFGKPALIWGEGGSIPFMGMLGEMFPAAQFVITGVLGPHSNAHGPNEFMHIGMFHGVTVAVASILADHYKAHVKA